MKKVAISSLILLAGISTVGFAANTTNAAKAQPVSAERSSEASTSSHGLKGLLSPIASMTASFQQNVRTEKGRVLQHLSGRLSLKKPGKFRWEVIGKEPRLVISDGKNVWDYDKELAQVTIQKMNKGQTKAPIFFLTGDVNSLDRDFKVTSLAANQGACLQGSDTCFELRPKIDEGAFQWIRIGFKNRALKEMEMLDQLGQRSQFIFSDIKVNPPIAEGEFHFTAPKGVDVLHNN